MGKKSTPKPPDLTPLSNAQLEISREQLAQAREQMGVSKMQFERFMKQSDLEMAQSQKQYDTQMALQQRALDQADKAAAVSKSVADKQISAMDQNMQYAQEDRQRYKDVALPLQDRFIADANAYDTPEKRAQAASQALADNQQQIEAQRANTASQLASMGVDPSQVMSTSLANQIGVAGAAMGAKNANDARLQVENTGRALRADAINMTNGLPAQSMAGYATATNAGNSAAANTNAATSGYSAASGIGATAAGIRQSSLNTASSITGSPMAWASLGNQSYGGASNGIMNASSIQNQMFQNNMSVQKMKNDQSAQTMQMIGSVAGAAMMMAEGGAVPEYYAEGTPSTLRLNAPRVSVTDIAGPDTRALESSVMSRARSDAMDARAARGDRTQAGLGLMAQMGKQSEATQSGDNPYLHNDLHPIYRAEGGAMGYGRGMAPAPRRMMAAPHMSVGAMHRMPMYAEGTSQYQVMPNLQARDKIPAMLAPGEVVVPADVVRIKGQEFFDKLIARHHRPGA